MSRRGRLCLSASLAALVSASVLLVLSTGREPAAGGTSTSSAAPSAGAPALTPRAPAVPSAPTEAAIVEPRAAAELPIEEILAEAGEDPGAVYYTSRVREAAREGNPRFARELLRQMRELHPSSVLVEEAEAIVESR